MLIRSGDVDRFLARPDPAVRLLLVFGPDDGLVSERMELFARAVLGAAGDPFAHVRLESSHLSEDPGRLADEAHAISLFGGRRFVSVRVSGNASLIPVLEPLIAHPPLDSWIVLGAGDLRKTSPLRRLFENAKGAAAIPCYADSARDLDRIIDEVAREAGLRIAADARALLRSLLGGDRLVSRSELAKLVLYVGEGEITVEDVLSVVGDASAFAVEEAVDAVAGGDTPTLVRSYRRLLAAGTPDFVVAGAALRHFDALHRARALFDQGADVGSVVGPQIFQKRREAMAKAIAAWPIARIERAIAVLDRAIADSRLQNAISAEVVGQALMTVVAMAPGTRARPQPAAAAS